MNKVLLTTTAIVGLSAPAFAADPTAVSDQPYFHHSHPMTWSGSMSIKLTNQSTKDADDITTKAKKIYHKFRFKKNDMLLFGRESAGVPKELHQLLKNKIKIPMNKKTRSLNVAMSVAIVTSEALRQNRLLK